MISKHRRYGLLALIALLSVTACEPLRPVAPEGEWSTPSRALQRAEVLLKKNASFDKISHALQLALGEAGDHPERLRIRRLKAMVHLRWFQLAHIARDLLIGIEGNDRVFTSLIKDLRSDIDSRKSPSLRAPGASKSGLRILDFLAPLIGKSSAVTRLSEVRRVLVKELSQLSRKSDRNSRDFASYSRRFLIMESSWHYNKSAAATKKRIREWLDFLNNFGKSFMVGHVWLTLRLTLAYSLKSPRIPTQSFLLALGELTGHKPPRNKTSAVNLLLAMGKGEGKTLPERLYVAWQGLKSTVESKLERYQPAPGSSADFMWSRLSAFLELHDDAGRPAVDDLYAIGDAVRAQAVFEWLVKNGLPGPGDSRTLPGLGALVAKGAGGSGLDDPQWVMAILSFQEIVGVQLVDVSSVRSIRLSQSGSFETRALRLPNGRQISNFPSTIKRCIEGRRIRICLKNLLARALSLAKQKR